MIPESFPTQARIIRSSDGSKIYADAAGNPDKPSIVFIHGMTFSGAVFDVIFSNEKYRQEFYLVRYDMRGHGRSAKPDTADGYASQLFADDFAAIKKAFKLQSPLLVGWSMGSTVLADIASYLPANTIVGAVYLSALPYIGSVMGRVATPTMSNIIRGLTCDESVSRVVDAAIKLTENCFTDSATVAWETRCLWLGMTSCQTPAHRVFLLTRLQNPDKLMELGAQGLPLLILHGTDDNIVNGEVVVEEMKPHFRDLEVVMVKGSHVLFYENTEEVMDRITSFMLRVRTNETKKLMVSFASNSLLMYNN
ncbi:alpha/beta-hydrolase [Phellopilus nigrolimitatus]|nr:alpha/beta-hydrolase [Phellopilus nigrolimitatus]